MSSDSDSRDDQVLASVLVELQLATPEQILKLMADAKAYNKPLGFAVFSRNVIPANMMETVDKMVAARQDDPAGDYDFGPSTAASKPPPTAARSATPAGSYSRSPLTDSALRTATPIPAPRTPTPIPTPRTATPVPAARRFVPKHLRQSDESPQLDVDSVINELGIGDSAAAQESNAGASALEETVRRVLPTEQHARCYISAMKHHHGSLTPVRLARAAGCSDDEAQAALDHWHKLGMMTRAEKGMPRYRFNDAAQDDPGVAQLRERAGKPEWSETLLSMVRGSENPDD